MNNYPEKKSSELNLALENSINRKILNSEYYFESLINHAYTLGLLSNSEMERIQYECIDLLAHQTERFNAGHSSSIRVEQAQEIMNSIIFTLGLYLKSFINSIDAVLELQNNSIEKLYRCALKQIDSMIKSTKSTHSVLINQLIETQNIFYQDTIKDGILGFFKLYYPEFGAHEIHITADYPLFNPAPKLLGIEFIKLYVEMSYYENKFCSFFATDIIHNLLKGYENDYQEMLINIYEIVLCAAIGCILLDLNPSDLNITHKGLIHLQKMFSSMPKESIIDTINKAIDKLVRHYNCSSKLTQYIQNSVKIISKKIETAIEYNTLNDIFSIPFTTNDSKKITFSFGIKISNNKYRIILDEIQQCRYLQDKLNIIKQNILSLADLEDLLLDAELDKKEVAAIINMLSLTEIAALCKKYHINNKIDILELKESEILLKNCLQNFINNLSPDKRKYLLHTINLIDNI